MTASSSLPTPRQSESPPAWRTIVSLLVFVHLFFVVVSLSGSYLRSSLTARLLNRFAFYTRFLNIDPDHTSYYLTHGTDADVDHRIEVQLRGDDRWEVIPGDAARGWDGYQRSQRFAAEWASHAGRDDQPALFAQSVGTYFVRQRDQIPTQVRCRKHYQLAREDLSSESASMRDPDDPSRYAVPYAANAILNSDRSVSVIRIEQASHVAAPVSSGGRAKGVDGR